MSNEIICIPADEINMNMAGYFDYNATTPMDPRVLQEMMPFFCDRFANPSSAYRAAMEPLAALELARARVASLIQATPNEIVFASGGTESDNLAIFGAACGQGRKSGHLITAASEHEAVLKPFRQLGKEGFELTLLPVNGEGLVDPEDLRRALRKDTILVSIMHANNETGVIQPIRELAAVTHESGGIFHTDAVQSVGKIPVSVFDLDVDMLSLSGHKIYGPKGIGALYVRRRVQILPLLWGGGQERGVRSGTENVPGIVGLGKAAELAASGLEEEALRLGKMRDRLQAEILLTIPGARINGNRSQRLANTLNLSLLRCEGKVVVTYLDHYGMALSAGSACSAKSHGPSHVLLAMGRDADAAASAIRISLGRFTRDEDIDELHRRLLEVVRKISP